MRPNLVPLHPIAIPPDPAVIPLHPMAIPRDAGAIPPFAGAIPLHPGAIQTNACPAEAEGIEREQDTHALYQAGL